MSDVNNTTENQDISLKLGNQVYKFTKDKILSNKIDGDSGFYILKLTENIKISFQFNNQTFTTFCNTIIYRIDDKTISAIILNRPTEISFTMYNCKNLILVDQISFYQSGMVYQFIINSNHTNKIKIITDNIKLESPVMIISFFESNNIKIQALENFNGMTNTHEGMTIKFKNNDIENEISCFRIIFNYDCSLQYILLSNNINHLVFYKKNHQYNIKIQEELRFYKNNDIKQCQLAEDCDLSFYIDGYKYDNLPFKKGDFLTFYENEELGRYCFLNSKERSAIVYAERLNKLERSQEQTKQEVKKLGEKQEIITRSDILLTLSWFALSLVFLYLGFSKLSEIEFGGGDFIEYDDYNKYVFLYEILKRMPAIILFVVAFKFLQLAFKRIELVGGVEQVRKYIKLTDDNATKNKLLEIIAFPFFTKKKMKSSVVAKLQDRGSSVALEGKEETD